MKKILFILSALNILSVSLYAQKIIDKIALDTLLKAANETQSDAIVIYKNGEIYGQYYFGKQPKPIGAMSVTKFISNLAIGKLITDGYLKSIDQPVTDFYPEWKQGMKKNITIRMLLNHTSGLQNVPIAADEINNNPDWVKLALAAEIVTKPGTEFSYNNKAVNLLSGIVKTLTHKRLDSYMRDSIFTLLGITDYFWEVDQEGNTDAMGGLSLLPVDLAKLGQFFLQKGNWEGKQIINSSWFLETVKPSAQNPTHGLLCFLDYDKIYAIIDDAQIDSLRKIGFDEVILKKIKTIKGKFLLADYFPMFNEKIVNTTANWNTKYRPILIAHNLTLSRKEYGKVDEYSHSGFLGNFISIFPENKLIVVRMISETSFKSGNGNTDDNGPHNFLISRY
jgi:CubicO group peptidase (beta-lactamase class C family)